MRSQRRAPRRAGVGAEDVDARRVLGDLGDEVADAGEGGEVGGDGDGEGAGGEVGEGVEGGAGGEAGGGFAGGDEDFGGAGLEEAIAGGLVWRVPGGGLDGGVYAEAEERPRPREPPVTMAILPATEKREGKSWRWASEVSDMVMERGGSIRWDVSVLTKGYGTAITDVEGVGVRALCTKVVVVVARDKGRGWVATPARIRGRSGRFTRV